MRRSRTARRKVQRSLRRQRSQRSQRRIQKRSVKRTKRTRRTKINVKRSVKRNVKKSIKKSNRRSQRVRRNRRNRRSRQIRKQILNKYGGSGKSKSKKTMLDRATAARDALATSHSGAAARADRHRTDDPEAHYTAVMKQFEAEWSKKGHKMENRQSQYSNLMEATGVDMSVVGGGEIDEDYIIRGGKFAGKHLLIPLLVDYNLGKDYDGGEKQGSNFNFSADRRIAELVEHYQHITMGDRLSGAVDHEIEAEMTGINGGAAPRVGEPAPRVGKGEPAPRVGKEKQEEEEEEEEQEEEQQKEGGLTEDLINGMRVVELRAELKARGLSTSGRRDALVERLVESAALEDIIIEVD